MLLQLRIEIIFLSLSFFDLLTQYFIFLEENFLRFFLSLKLLIQQIIFRHELGQGHSFLLLLLHVINQCVLSISFCLALIIIRYVCYCYFRDISFLFNQLDMLGFRWSCFIMCTKPIEMEAQLVELWIRKPKRWGVFISVERFGR